MIEICCTQIPVQSYGDWYALGPQQRLDLLRQYRADSNAIRYYEIKLGLRTVKPLASRKKERLALLRQYRADKPLASRKKITPTTAQWAYDLGQLTHNQWIRKLTIAERYYISHIAAAIAI